MRRLDELTLKLLDQTIGEDEQSELAELTQHAEGRESMLRMMELESQLRASGRSSVAGRVLDQIQQERCDRVEEGVMRAVTGSGTTTRAHPHGTQEESSSRLAFLFVGIAAIAACLLLVFSAVNRNDDGDSSLAVLKPHGSIVRILDADGNARRIQTTDEAPALSPNETIETSQAIDTAEIVYADGTKIVLLGETQVRMTDTSDGSKAITILSGLVQADVAPQPDGRPLRIITQTATLEVLGTTLGVEVRDASTQLGVAHGRVAMTRKVDGQRVEVEAGRFATADESADQPLLSHPFPELPSEWSEDFEGGLPAGWRTGELVDFQDAAAVKAVRSRWTDDGRYVITSHNAWQEGRHGLFQIDENSVLHLRIRQSTFARITIMIGTRSYPPATGRIGGNLFFTKKAWNEDLPAGTWKTVSVPLKDVAWQVKQGKRVSGPPNLEGIAAYLLHVSTMNEDAGLAIDRLWITNEPERPAH